MKSAWIVALVGTLVPAVGCMPPKDSDTKDSSSTGTQTSSTGVGGAGGASSTTGSGGATSTGAGGDTTSSGAGGAKPAASCSDGVLFAGNPRFNGDFGGWNPAGQKLLDDPPLRFEHLDFIGSHLVTETLYEVWAADTSAASPTIARIAGDENEPNERFEAGVPCANARFLQIAGIAARTDGTLVVADRIGNGVVEITDPLGPSCAVKYVAGQSTMISSGDAGSAANPGDVDGPGAQAKFDGVAEPVVDASGNIYVLDTGNGKVKKIANDASRTVSTLADLSDPDGPQYKTMTLLGGKLYVAGLTITKDFLVSVDPVSGTLTSIYKGSGIYPELQGGTGAITSLDQDGEALIAAGDGYIWRVGTDGKVLATLAGIGSSIDFPSDFDVSTPHPATEWPLLANSGSHLKLHDGQLYWRGIASGIGFYVVRFACP